jgi:hypothetical protein
MLLKSWTAGELPFGFSSEAAPLSRDRDSVSALTKANPLARVSVLSWKP